MVSISAINVPSLLNSKEKQPLNALNAQKLIISIACLTSLSLMAKGKWYLVNQLFAFPHISFNAMTMKNKRKNQKALKLTFLKHKKRLQKSCLLHFKISKEILLSYPNVQKFCKTALDSKMKKARNNPLNKTMH